MESVGKCVTDGKRQKTESSRKHVHVPAESAGKEESVKHMMIGLKMIEKMLWHPGSLELVCKRISIFFFWFVLIRIV